LSDTKIQNNLIGFNGTGKSDYSESGGGIYTDGKVVNMDVSYTYHYDASKLAQVFTKFKGQSPSIIENTFIRRELKDALNKVTTQYGVVLGPVMIMAYVLGSNSTSIGTTVSDSSSG